MGFCWLTGDCDTLMRMYYTNVHFDVDTFKSGERINKCHKKTSLFDLYAPFCFTETYQQL